MIQVTHLTKSFGPVQAVQDVSFSAPDGLITGLLGPNGAGKSTTMRLVAGALEPDSGQTTIDGFDTHTQLGMAPCSWPATYGMPCPTCGCTTAACLVVHGRLLRAYAVQPFGASVAVAGLLLAALAVYCLARGHSFADWLCRLPRGRLLLAGITLLLASWAYRVW